MRLLPENETYFQNPSCRGSYVYSHGLYELCAELTADFRVSERFSCACVWSKSEFSFFPPFTVRRICEPARANCFEFTIFDTSRFRIVSGSPVFKDPPQRPSRRIRNDCAYSIRFDQRRCDDLALTVTWGRFSSHQANLNSESTLEPIHFDFSLSLHSDVERIRAEMRRRISNFVSVVPTLPRI